MQDQTLFPLDDFQLTEATFSKVSLFLQCKFRYKSKHIERILRQDQRSTFYLSVGRSLHNALAELFDPTKHYSELDSEDLKRFLRRHWIADGFVDAKEMEDWFSRCLGILVRVFNSSENADNVILVEKVFKQQYGGYIFSSRVDRVDKLSEEECQIIDYKVGGSAPEPSKVDELQWVFHYLASRTFLEETFGLKITKISFYYLVADELVSFEPTSRSIDEGMRRIMGILSEMEQEASYPPTINKYCSDCRFDMICPAIKELQEKGISLDTAIRSLH